MSETDPDTRKVIAIAGAGDLGRYVCEEFLKSPTFAPIVLSRGTQDKWFSAYPDLPVHKTDYTASSLLSILDSTHATTLISFINLSSPSFITTHTNLLTACAHSLTCKRLIPSEWIGDVETYPLKPAFYAETREPVRRALRAQSEVEWTLFEVGWLADYFLGEGKGGYMTPAKETWLVDVDGWGARVRGSGDEGQSWTAARDVGRAVVELCKAEKWEPVTYVAGEWNTFNNAIQIIESFYGRPMPRTQKSREEIQEEIAAYTAKGDSGALEGAQIEEMMVMGCLECPKEKTLRQRAEFFSRVEFLDLRQMLALAEKEGKI